MSKSSKQAGNTSSTQNNKNNNSNALKVRLDKWLWAARFYKTRSIAKDMIDGGKVHYEDQRVNQAKKFPLVQPFAYARVMMRKPSLSSK